MFSAVLPIPESSHTTVSGGMFSTIVKIVNTGANRTLRTEGTERRSEKQGSGLKCKAHRHLAIESVCADCADSANGTGYAICF